MCSLSALLVVLLAGSIPPENRCQFVLILIRSVRSTFAAGPFVPSRTGLPPIGRASSRCPTPASASSARLSTG